MVSFQTDVKKADGISRAYVRSTRESASSGKKGKKDAAQWVRCTGEDRKEKKTRRTQLLFCVEVAFIDDEKSMLAIYGLSGWGLPAS